MVKVVITVSGDCSAKGASDSTDYTNQPAMYGRRSCSFGEGGGGGGGGGGERGS